MENIVGQYYNTRLSTLESQLVKLEKRSKLMPWIRSILFAGFIVAAYFYPAHSEHFVLLITTILFFFAFIYFFVRSNKLKKQIQLLQYKKSLLTAEMNAMQGDFSFFDPGKEFIDPAHDYAFDLDIFGEHSIFQMLNRTCTQEGRNRLAYELKNSYELSANWEKRQNAIKELCLKNEFRENLQSAFYDVTDNEPDHETFYKWLEHNLPFKKGMMILAYALPLVNIGCIVMSAFNIISFPLILPIILLAVTAYFGKTTMREMQQAGHSSRILSRYASILMSIENEEFHSEYLTDIQKNKLTSFHKTASASVHELAKLVNYLDSNLNILISVLLNGLFLFNIHLMLRIQQWKKTNSKKANEWFESIALVDSLCSFANFHFNNPEFSFPEIALNGDYIFDAVNIGHPLINQKVRVNNSFKTTGWSSYCVITGANMAGKSTFLRTLGVNQVLAMLGSVVCADKLSITASPLYTSLRTSDSLAENESYFYAELKRLQWIINNVRENKLPLILLDEILKGTNSADKQAGSIALLKELLEYKSVGIIATHDVALGKLEEVYPEQVHNYCFEIQINGKEMQINYMLQPGISKNLNATFLMHNMGILKHDDIHLQK